MPPSINRLRAYLPLQAVQPSGSIAKLTVPFLGLIYFKKFYHLINRFRYFSPDG